MGTDGSKYMECMSNKPNGTRSMNNRVKPNDAIEWIWEIGKRHNEFTKIQEG